MEPISAVFIVSACLGVAYRLLTRDNNEFKPQDINSDINPSSTSINNNDSSKEDAFTAAQTIFSREGRPVAEEVPTTYNGDLTSIESTHAVNFRMSQKHPGLSGDQLAVSLNTTLEGSKDLKLLRSRGSRLLDNNSNTDVFGNLKKSTTDGWCNPIKSSTTDGWCNPIKDNQLGI